jgi:hypothetical protein
MEMKKRFWTEAEAAEAIGVPSWRIKYLRQAGKINPMKIGRTLAYTGTDVKIARMLIGGREDQSAGGDPSGGVSPEPTG